MEILTEEKISAEIKELEKEQRIISEKLEKLKNKQKIVRYKNHESYVGKCYKHKDKNKYYKVLSNYSENDTRLTCLIFNLDDDVYHCSLRSASDNVFFYDYPNICLDITMFEVDSVFTFGYSNFFDKVMEITTEQFEFAQQEMINKFAQETKEISCKVRKLVENNYKKLYE